MTTRRQYRKKTLWKSRKLKRMYQIEYIRTHKKIGKIVIMAG